ncbi:MAG: PD40 domain-containing protein [Lentisphaeria bacterium]|nr:PD40 domain-containing protein [Lentisphaeria bacterium]
MRHGVCVFVAWFAVGVVAGAAPAPLLRFDFESDLEGWRIVEGAFGRFRCDRAEYHHHGGAYKKRGRFFLSTLESPESRPDDGYTGVAESPVFVLSAPRVSFLVGGGNHANTYVALCTVAGGEVKRAQGRRHQEMVDVAWDLPEFVGKPLFLRLADGHRGGWGHVTFDGFEAEGRVDEEATRSLAASRKPILAALEAMSAAAPAPPPVLPSSGSPSSLRAAIEDLVRRFPAWAREGQDHLQALAGLEERMPGAGEPVPAELAAAFAALQRRVFTCSPLLRGLPILFAVRQQYRPDHHNTATMFQTGTVNTGSYRGGGALKVLDFGADGVARVRVLLDAGADGVARDPEVHFSGDRVLFSLRRSVADDTHVYEIRADGSGLRQLTSAPGVSDIDPLYLPDGSIVFTSTREPKFCMCNVHIMGNLFRMDADGANIHEIGHSTLHEGHASLLPDGRILYDRWEYVDRNFGDAQGLWTVHADGTNHAIYWGNNTASPGGVLDGRAIPGTQQVLCTFGSCHDRPWGAIAVIDRRLAVDGRPGTLRTWPAAAMELVDKGNFDTFKTVYPKYEDPFPLAGQGGDTAAGGRVTFLCSRQTGEGETMGIYLLDSFGNEVLLHAEAPGCFDPMPLAPRPCPPQAPLRADSGGDMGVFVVQDVYEGTHMAGVRRGEACSLRVVESPEKRFWTGPAWGGQGVHRPAMNWHSFENKRILGTVPVAADGSVCVRVPADRFVYFQLLDAKGMMIQSMRSGTIVRAGEVTGCVGCHEPRQAAPPPPRTAGMLEALRAPPGELSGWLGSTRIFSYLDEVQPVLERHCVRCHDFGGRGSGKVLLSGDRSETFNVSYNELWRRRLITAVGGGPAAIQPARSWGSSASRVVRVLLSGHNGVRLSEEDFLRLVTWIDLNAPYYPTYASAFPGNLTGRCPLPPPKLARLAALTGVDFGRLASHHANRGPQITFDRPERSPCLAGLAEAGGEPLAEALTIIREGQAALAANARGDSAADGIAMCAVDAAREAFYAERARIEAANRQALREGARLYDPGLTP